MRTKLSQLVGKIIRKDAAVIMIFKVGDKYYPATEYNSELFESYLHTGDEFFLSALQNEMEV